VLTTFFRTADGLGTQNNAAKITQNNSSLHSYGHENDDHGKAVRTLGEMLKAADLPVKLDQFYVDAHPGGPDET
jgi:hypothetical protein